MSGLHYRQQVLTWSNKYVVYSVTHSITYRESQVELWTPTAGYTAPSPSPPDGWASRWLNDTPFLFSEYLCPGLRCCSPGCRSPGPWGQDRTRVPQILPGQKMWYLTFNVFIINNFIKFAYLCLTSDIKRSSEKSYLTDNLFWFLTRSGAQGVTMSVCMSLRHKVFSCLNHHLSLTECVRVSGQTQDSVSSITDLIEQTEPKILRLDCSKYTWSVSGFCQLYLLTW